MQKIKFRNICFKLLVVGLCFVILLAAQGLFLRSALAEKAAAPDKLYTVFKDDYYTKTMTAVSWSSPQKVHVFGISTDGTIRQRTFDGATSTWGTWVYLAAPPVSGRVFNSLEAVSWGPGRIDLFGVDNWLNVWHKYYSNNAWWPAGTWEDMGGGGLSNFSYMLKAVSWGSGRIDIFNTPYPYSAAYHKSYTSGVGWSPSQTEWENLGFYAGNFVSWGANRIDSVYRNGAGRVYHYYYTASSNAWRPAVPGEKLGDDSWSVRDPLILSTGSKRLSIFARLVNPSNLLYKAWTGSKWTDWIDIGGDISDNVACDVAGISWGPGRFDLFEVRGGSAPGVYHKGYDGTYWYPNQIDWEYVGGERALDSVQVTSWGANRLDIFAVRTDGSLWHLAWNGSNWWPSVNSWELVNP